MRETTEPQEAELARRYDADYYASHLGVPYTWENPWWPEFFGRIAAALVDHVAPESTLDVGCALGFLVAALRDRGVEAHGIDISEFAIGEVPKRVRSYCRVGSLSEPIGRRFDLITCIEVLEHMPPEHAEEAIANLCGHADWVLFSSTPTDEIEPTHLNVRPPSYWTTLFARHGFFRDPRFEAGVVAPHACLFARRKPGLAELAGEYEELYVEARLREAGQAERLRSLADRAQEAEADTARVAALETALHEWEAIEQRTSWRMYNALFRLGVRLAPPGTLRGRTARRTLRDLIAAVERTRTTSDHQRGERDTLQKSVLFLSGCPGDAKRYRADHQAEQLAFLGVTGDACLTDEIGFDEILDTYRCVVLHRVAWDLSLERLLSEAARRGIRVLFDTDDLLFDPDAIHHVAALADKSDDERELFVDGVRRYRQTLQSVDGAIVSTDALAEEARRVCESVDVAYNVVSAEMVRLADAARPGTPSPTAKPLTVAYLSGTPTHSRDFDEAADSILWMLEQYPGSRFVAVGHLELDRRFEQFGSRVSRVPFQPWQKLAAIITTVDVNLAPLEPNNPFTDSKSCLKYMEAGLVGVPTIASPRRDFVRAIRHGENGLLAESPAEWRSALKQLAESPAIRNDIGRRAYEDVREKHTTLARARSFHSTLRALGRSRADDSLTVNWVVGAPIPRTGGYRTIFRLAADLAGRGHRSRMYVEPSAHLKGMSPGRIETFLEEHFGQLPFDVHIGHDRIAPADVSFATNWLTAPTVATQPASLFKGYLVQDYEPSVYAEGDPLRTEIHESYDLPLRHICYGPEVAARLERATGRPADGLEFALEPEFQLTKPLEARLGPPRILFFAKPDQARRGFGIGAAALALVHEEAPEVEIVLFGSTDDELGELRFRHRNLGSLATSELAAALNEAHVFLSLSLTNISHAPYEAMACGCAVVEARTPSIEGSLHHGENWVLSELAPDALATSLLQLVRDEELRLRLARRGIEGAADMTWARTGARLEELLLDWAFVRLDARIART